VAVIAKINSKGQITLPKKVLDVLHLREGGVVVFEQENGNKFVMKPVQSLLDYKGYLKGRVRPADTGTIRDAARTHVGRKTAKNCGR
jgi:AbrB family looped-hinge helix DNA binding protein